LNEGEGPTDEKLTRIAEGGIARLWQRQGRRAESYDLLAPIYHWFTEGFDMPDLRAAQAAALPHSSTRRG